MFWLFVGLLASGTSLVIAISVGLQRGSSALEKSTFATALVVAVLATHGQWAPYRHLPSRWRVGAPFIRLSCLVAVLYAHGAFFATALLEGGEQRAAAVMVFPADEPTQRPRVASSILVDLAKERAAQAALNRQSCDIGCSALRDRKNVLNARVEALQAELAEARKWATDRDRLEQRRAAARKDPATDELASALGMTETMTRLVFSVMMAVILDGVGCLSWRAIVWHRSSTDGQRTSPVREGSTKPELDSREMGAPVAAMDAGHHSRMTGPEASAVTRPSDHDSVARQEKGVTEQRVAEGVEIAVAALRSGQIRGTVQEIQRLIGRSQLVASEVRKALQARGELPAPASPTRPG